MQGGLGDAGASLVADRFRPAVAVAVLIFGFA